MAQTDLCTLAQLKAYLGDSGSLSDAQLSRMISAASRALLNEMGRAIYPGTITEQRSGVGSNRIQLREWPVRAVSALSIGGVTVPANPNQPPTGSGWTLQPQAAPGPPGAPQMLWLMGYSFPAGFGNISLSYSYGYAIDGEAATVPAATTFTVTPAAPYGQFCGDQGVTLADGTPLIPVASPPAAGQYSVDAAGVYTFNAAQASAAVLISYGYIPADLTEACIETASEWFRARERIGIASKGLAGQEQISYSQKDLNSRVKLMIGAYSRVAAPY